MGGYVLVFQVSGFFHLFEETVWLPMTASPRHKTERNNVTAQGEGVCSGGLLGDGWMAGLKRGVYH